ncbi:phage major capsid protein [Agrobacterium vitis]|uniref:phage major capsid protein n=1 Tax=Agrobacterium vitis TaxID=373 RepID=UPI0015725F64|nr:phage major capsid protein [Agrobacterium vitis]NSZ52969.1 phage major capsid protein [Agrobacterium vitis]NTA31728.1 phage major capsid protein [Agrobacterium vitis]
MTVTRRAYSYLNIKAVNEEKRIIRGIATTPAVDRVGDIVEPLGVKFNNPLPFLWQHDAGKPIGTVKFDKPTTNGITFEAELPIIDEPGTLKDRVDEAWQSIKLGLVRAVSIGFRAIEYSFMENGGIKFAESEVYELSAVTIPAQAEAVMTSIKNMDAAGLAVIKSFDTAAPAATGEIKRPSKVTPGATGKSKHSVNLTIKENTAMKTIAEQIAALEASRQAKSARMAEVMQKSMDEGRSTDTDEQEEFDTLSVEVEAIDGDLKRLRTMEKMQATNAKPVIANQMKNAEFGTSLRNGVQIKANEPDKGIRFARYAKCLAISTKTHQPIVGVAKQLYGKTDPDLIDIVKAAVSAMTTSNTAELIGNEGGFADFVEFLRPMTVLGRFGTGNIPSLTRIPFRVPLISEASESDAQWVGEGKAKPLTRMTAGRTELNPLKIATIAVQTMELIRDSSPSSDILIRNSLAKAIAKRSDLSFIDPANAPSAGVRPGSILNGVTATANSTATGADGVREDVQALIGAFVAANNALQSGVWVMSATYALRLMMMLNPLGQREFPGITMQGGTFFELPVVVSNYLTDYVALVNAEDIWVADEGGVDIAMSTEASLEMDSAPTHDSNTPTPAELVSMFQTNSVAFRAERTINWARRRASAVAWMDNITWGEPVVTP